LTIIDLRQVLAERLTAANPDVLRELLSTSWITETLVN
jgi:hypothetical protein